MQMRHLEELLVAAGRVVQELLDKAGQLGGVGAPGGVLSHPVAVGLPLQLVHQGLGCLVLGGRNLILEVLQDH